MKKVLLILLAIAILIGAWPLAQASDATGYFKAVVGLSGLVFLGWAWSRGKGTTQMAIEIGKSAGMSRRNKGKKAGAPQKEAAKPRSSGKRVERDRAVFLCRKPRAAGDVTRIGTSWIGGLPALGGLDWPRDRLGYLMHHVMQIDLSEAGPKLNVQGLPVQGSLAVFASLGGDKATTFETALRYVINPSNPTLPPEPLSPIEDNTVGGDYVHGADPDTLGTLPRWALDLIGFDASQSDIPVKDRESLREALSLIYPLGTEMNFSARAFAKDLPNGVKPSYWHSAQLFARSFDQAVRSDYNIKSCLDMVDRTTAALERFKQTGLPKGAKPKMMEETIARNIAQVERMRSLKPDMERGAQTLKDWAFAHDPWEVMSTADLKGFEQAFVPFSYADQGSDEQLFYRYSHNSYGSLEQLTNATLQVMATGPQEIFELLPDSVQRALDETQLTPGMPHQMFGIPADIQGGAGEHERDHLLLQIVHDDLIGLRLGDVGHIQIWISPKNLAAGRFDRAVSFFEGH